MLSKAKAEIWQRIRAAYYAFDWIRQLPFSERLGHAVHEWEIVRGYGDSPKEKAGWDAQFGAGQWDYMRGEEPRYLAIVELIREHAPSGAILDIGCGEGILFSFVRETDYRQYVGIDISQVAIDRIAHLNDARHHFSQADADQYKPTQSFDAVILNESLYYLREPIKALRRYVDGLNPGGVCIISTYTKSRRALAILRDAKRHLRVLREISIVQGEMSWICTVFAAPLALVQTS